MVWYEYLNYSKHSWPSPQPSWKPLRNFNLYVCLRDPIFIWWISIFKFENTLRYLILMYILKSMSKRWIDLLKTIESVGNSSIHYSKVNLGLNVMVWNCSDTNKFNWISNFKKINFFLSEVLTEGASYTPEAPVGDSLQGS